MTLGKGVFIVMAKNQIPTQKKNDLSMSPLDKKRGAVKHGDLLRTVNLVAGAMLSTDVDTHFENSFLSGMELLGLNLNVDRVQIWQNEMIDGELCFIHKYEWLSEVGKTKPPVPIGLKFSYLEKPRWKEKFLRNEYISCPVEELPPEDRDFIGGFEIKSIVIIPIFLRDEFWGFFSIDDCILERTFSIEEIDILHSASLMMANAINRHSMFEKMQQAEHDLRLARDAAESSSHAKSTFLANMSHEIRTPMNSIIGFTELALDDDIPPRTRDYLNKINENSEWLMEIINDVLDISKIESGKLSLEKIPFDLHDIFSHCQTVITPKALEKGISLYFYAEPSIGKKLIGDSTRLRQVLINLITNAVKFTRVGTVKVSSYIKSSTDDTVSVYFEVRDSGIGMTTEEIERIYEPFIQADSSTTRKYGGTGLGLPISLSIIEFMGGKLEVESTPGVGSRFSFELTFDTIDLPEEQADDRIIKTGVEKPIFKGEILVCEDNTMNQQVICDHLMRVGLNTVVAHNGMEGVEMVKSRIENGEKPFDLIFMDIYMPVMDGLEAAAIISELKTETPIVAMTANIMLDDKGFYELNGLPGYLSKPFTSQELWRCLLQYLEPVSISYMEKQGQLQEAQDNYELQKKLRLKFVNDYQNKYDEIAEAISTEDTTHAHMLVHSLKSNAGMIGKHGLQKAAAEIEALLKEGMTPIKDEYMAHLKTELAAAIEELQPLLDEPEEKAEREPLSAEQTSELFEKLEPMLMSRNSECINLLDDIRSVPGLEDLAHQIENYNFKLAAQTLFALKKEWI